MGGGTDASKTLPRPADAREMLRMAQEFLERKGVEEARLDAELLVGHALGAVAHPVTRRAVRATRCALHEIG